MTFEEYEAEMKRLDPLISHMFDRRDGSCLIVKRLMFHWTLLLSTIGDFEQYDDRWCYETQGGAVAGAEQWIELGGLMPNNEPMGWNRHHKTGRRRTNGDPSTEYINH